MFENSVTTSLDLVNSEVVEINKLECVWTIEWAGVIRKRHKKSCGRKNKNAKVPDSFNFDRLYDGLHAKSHIKNKWFQFLMKACTCENQLNKSKGNKKCCKVFYSSNSQKFLCRQ